MMHCRTRCHSILVTSATPHPIRTFRDPSAIGHASSSFDSYHSLVSTSTINSANSSFTRSGGCRDQIQSCYSTGSTSTCSKAQSFCNNNILSPLAGNYDVYFILAKNPDAYPPDLSTYLGSSSLKSKIGAESDWQETNDQVYDNFASTGDWMTNSRPHLENVIKAGVRTLIYVGDAVSDGFSF
jgi:carboxypeptidase C (cathepsin A)